MLDFVGETWDELDKAIVASVEDRPTRRARGFLPDRVRTWRLLASRSLWDAWSPCMQRFAYIGDYRYFEIKKDEHGKVCLWGKPYMSSDDAELRRFGVFHVDVPVTFKKEAPVWTKMKTAKAGAAVVALKKVQAGKYAEQWDLRDAVDLASGEWKRFEVSQDFGFAELPAALAATNTPPVFVLQFSFSEHAQKRKTPLFRKAFYCGGGPPPRAQAAARCCRPAAGGAPDRGGGPRRGGGRGCCCCAAASSATGSAAAHGLAEGLYGGRAGRCVGEAPSPTDGHRPTKHPHPPPAPRPGVPRPFGSLAAWLPLLGRCGGAVPELPGQAPLPTCLRPPGSK